MARQKIKSCILDGAALADAAAVYRALGDALGAPAYFGHNPDALWDAIGDYHGEPVEIVWRHSAQSAARLGPGFEQIVAVLRRAEQEGRAKLRLD
ncbi:MAG TPA: barstar family protein [Xanthobacteraceae bacterium]|jgi:RNAse (barnase) inhibitor barstar|nr:barstar family protein [Xanthobacteraceae bacterium]